MLIKQRKRGHIPSSSGLRVVRSILNGKKRTFERTKKRPKRKTLPGVKRKQHFILASLLTDAFISDRIHIRLKVATGVKFPAGFPVGVVEQELEGYTVVRVIVKKALAWMCEMGYTELSMQEALELRREALASYNSIERRMFNG